MYKQSLYFRAEWLVLVRPTLSVYTFHSSYLREASLIFYFDFSLGRLRFRIPAILGPGRSYRSHEFPKQNHTWYVFFAQFSVCFFFPHLLEREALQIILPSEEFPKNGTILFSLFSLFFWKKILEIKRNSCSIRMEPVFAFEPDEGRRYEAGSSHLPSEILRFFINQDKPTPSHRRTQQQHIISILVAVTSEVEC